MVSNGEDFIFYSCLLGLLIKLHDDATRPNCRHQTKINDTLLQIVRVLWHNALKIVANELTHVSVPAEDG
jgi:hypothetical protein